jgi:hypothetical protein
MAYTKYSLTPANNNAAPPDGAPEGMLPSAVNDTMRDMMAQIRDVGDGIRGGTYTMTAPVITGGSVTGSTINNSAIGGTTAAAGKFTTLEATGVTTVQAGTVSAPAITTTGDTNTGIFFPAADTIAFTEGGVESMRIDSSGLVGIGTNSPSSFSSLARNLVVQGGATTGITISETTGAGTATLQFAATSSFVNKGYISCDTANAALLFGTSTAERMRITNTGNVGINESNPTQKLTVSGNILVRDGDTIFSSGQLYVRSGAGKTLDFGSDNVNSRMILDSSGNLCVGTSSAFLTSRVSVESANSNNGRITQNIYNSAATSTTKAVNTLVRIASNGSGADTCINFTDSVAKNYWFGGNNGGAYVVAGNNGVRLAEDGTSWASDSDERLKDIIEPISDALTKVNSLRSVIGKYKTDEDGVRRSFLIAQDVQAVLPEAVVAQQDEIGTLSLAYTEVIPLLVASIKELKATVDAQAARIAALESK